jgi:predicted ATPase
MIHLRSLTYQKNGRVKDRFPHNLPVIRSLETLNFESGATFLVGENGSGKSTLLEAIACAVSLPTVGSLPSEKDPTLDHVRSLADSLKLVWNKRVRRGFFMRSEDFFGFVKHIAQTRQEIHDDLKAVDAKYADRSEYARNLARMAHTRELHGITAAYGDGLDAQSHGESYFKLFQSRFVPDGLYLLDEPEAPLSPMRQMTFISLLHLALKQNAQFIIATHSPIILAYPDAAIFSFDGEIITRMTYDELDHVTVTRSFLENPESYLRHLMEDE